MYTNFGPRAQQRGGQPAAPVNPWAQLLHFLPILLLVAFTFFSTQSEPVRPPCSAGHCTCRPPCAAVPTFYAVFCTSSSCDTAPTQRWRRWLLPLLCCEHVRAVWAISDAQIPATVRYTCLE